MNFFGMGGWEIGLILIVALIIFGPGKLPEVAGQVGKAVRDFRRMTSEMTGEFERQTGVKDIKKTLEKELTGVKNEVSSAGKSIERDLQKSANTVNSTINSAKSSTKSTTTTSSSAVKPADQATKSSSGASSSSTKPATAVATKKDPLADLIVFADEAESTAPASTQIGTSPNGASASTSETVVAADALSRARLRRQRAGYNRTTGVSADN